MNKKEYEQGNECVRSGAFELAVESYQRAILIGSNDHEDPLLLLKLHLNLAHCHLKLRNFEIARDHCSECLRRDPMNIKALIRRALALEGLGNFNESLEDISIALKINTSPALIHEMVKIQRRVRQGSSMDKKALSEETVPVSYVTSNQSLRLNFGSTYPNKVSQDIPFRLRLNITNEFGLWNRLHLCRNSDSQNPVDFFVEALLIPMTSSAPSLTLRILSNPQFGSNGRVELTLSISSSPPSSPTNELSTPFLLKFFCSHPLPSGLPIHPILSLPILFSDDPKQLPPPFLTSLFEMTSKLSANGIRLQSIECQDRTHDVYVLECPGSLGIGGKVWDATYVILDYLQTVPEYLTQRHVVELGSGTGLVGLSLRHFHPDRVVLTDVAPVVPLLKANILLNQLLSHSSPSVLSSLSPLYDAVTHLWGTPIDPLITEPSPNYATQQPAIIIASDVVYDPAGFEPLLKSIQSLLLTPLPTNGRPFADRVILAHRHRNPEDYQFFAMISSSESGLSLVEINLDHIFAKYLEGDNSLRDVKLFHITSTGNAARGSS